MRDSVLAAQDTTRDIDQPSSARLTRANARLPLGGAPQEGIGPPAITLPARLDITMLTSDMAEMATWIGGVERTGDRSISLVDDDPLALYRRFVAVIAVTRGLDG